MGLEVLSSGEWSWPRVVAFAWALLATPFLLVWFFFLRREKLQKQKYRLPPGPPTWPIIGNIGALIDTTKPTHQVVNDLAKVYGPILLLKVGAINLVFVSGAEETMEINKTQDHLFSYRPEALPSGKYLLYGNSHLTMGQPGENHTFFRKFVVSELLSYKKLQGFKGIRMEEQTLVIREAYLASHRQESIDVRRLFHTVTLNVITRMGFGKKYCGLEVEVDDVSKSENSWPYIISEISEKFAQILAETLHPSLYWVDTLTGTRRGMQSTFKRMDARCQELVEEHKQRLDALTPKELREYQPKDFMDILLLRRNKENAQFMTDRNLKAITMDLIVAGSDTSATTMEWAMTELIANPDLMKRAQEEVDSVVGLDRVVDESDSPNLPFLNAVVKETFRLHPPTPWLLPHSNRVDCKDLPLYICQRQLHELDTYNLMQVGGYDIPKGSIINMNVYGMSRNASYWEDPLRFNPDRFYKTDSQIETKGAHPQLLPFGMGRRICPGIYMTSVIINSTLARMIHSFDWTPDWTSVETKNGAPKFDLREKSGAIAAKLVSLKAFPTSRLPPHLFK